MSNFELRFCCVLLRFAAFCCVLLRFAAFCCVLEPLYSP
jgi:hypothetical protein